MRPKVTDTTRFDLACRVLGPGSAGWQETKTVKLAAFRHSAAEQSDAQHDDRARTGKLEAAAQSQAEFLRYSQESHEAFACEDGGNSEAGDSRNHSDSHGSHGCEADRELMLGDCVRQNEGRQRARDEPGDEGEHSSVASVAVHVRARCSPQQEEAGRDNQKGAGRLERWRSSGQGQ